jgi:uncharacterized protein (TIGR02284 family)
MSHSDDITVLNTLIATTLDSMKGYNEACEDDDGRYAGLFREMAQERSQTASRLQARVRELGGDPEDDSSTMGALHRGFLNLKQAVTGSDEESLIKEVERGEDYLKEKYERGGIRLGEEGPRPRQCNQARDALTAPEQTVRGPAKQAFAGPFRFTAPCT